MRVSALNFEIRFPTDHKEAAGLLKAIEALEVQEASVHDVESAQLGRQVVEDVDLVHLAVADVNKTRAIAAQIEQRVHFHRCFGGSKRSPRKCRKIQIDRRGIRRVDRLLEIDPKRFVDVKPSGSTNQALSEVGVNAPVRHRAGVSQSIACHDRSNSQVMKLGALGVQAGFDVPKALAIRQL
jgi:hypothetical protein